MQVTLVPGQMKLKEIIVELIKNPSGKIWIQMFRYLVSGGIAFIVDAGLLTVLSELAGEELLLLWTGIGFTAGLTITYLLSILWVFDKRSIQNRYAEISIFVIIGVIGLILTEAFMWIFAKHFGIHYLLSKIITTILVFIWNFIAKKTVLFRNK